MLCEVAHEHQLAEVDFLLVAEMTLRIAMVLESSMDALQSGRKTGTIVMFRLPRKRDVRAGNVVTPELAVFQYTGWKSKMDASRPAFVVLVLSEYKHIKKIFCTDNAEVLCPQIEVG